jgi:hypothetical protein
MKTSKKKLLKLRINWLSLYRPGEALKAPGG